MEGFVNSGQPKPTDNVGQQAKDNRQFLECQCSNLSECLDCSYLSIYHC